jgi:hypothetical protein
MYRLEVERHLKSGDRLNAAQLLEDKLSAPEEALTVLAEGWPHSPQASKCLAAEFELFARKAWHNGAAARLQKLRENYISPDLVTSLAQVLATQALQYPDRAIRHSAADLMRVKASQRLEAATPAEVYGLGNSLIKLAPNDRLLARDVSRFSALRIERLRTSKRITPVRKVHGPILVRTFELPKRISWHTVKSCGGYFFAAGNGADPLTGRDKLFLIRGDWEGTFQIVRWPAPVLPPPPLLLEFDEQTSRPPRVIITPGPSRPLIRLPERAFPAADRFAGVVPVGTPDWLPDDLFAICTRGIMVWLLREFGGGLVECRLLDGTLVSTLAVGDAFAQTPGAILRSSLMVERDFLWLAAKQGLSLFRQGKLLANWQAETDIVSLVPSAPNLPSGALVRLEKGVSLHWTDALKEQTETLCEELTQPLAAFTADGTLVLVAGSEGRICDVNQRGVNGLNAFTLAMGGPIAVVRAESSNQFAVFSGAGHVQLFRVST